MLLCSARDNLNENFVISWRASSHRQLVVRGMMDNAAGAHPRQGEENYNPDARSGNEFWGGTCLKREDVNGILKHTRCSSRSFSCSVRAANQSHP